MIKKKIHCKCVVEVKHFLFITIIEQSIRSKSSKTQVESKTKLLWIVNCEWESGIKNIKSLIILNIKAIEDDWSHHFERFWFAFSPIYGNWEDFTFSPLINIVSPELRKIVCKVRWTWILPRVVGRTFNDTHTSASNRIIFEWEMYTNSNLNVNLKHWSE